MTHFSPGRVTVPPLSSKLLFCAVLISSASLHGCLLEPGDCATEARYGLRITVRDAQTGAPAGFGARVTATSGSYGEDLAAFTDSLTFVGATERAGTYDILVSRTGYQSWTRQGVVVRPGRCHVDAQAIEARIQPIVVSPNRE